MINPPEGFRHVQRAVSLKALSAMNSRKSNENLLVVSRSPGHEGVTRNQLVVDSWEGDLSVAKAAWSGDHATTKRRRPCGRQQPLQSTTSP